MTTTDTAALIAHLERDAAITREAFGIVQKRAGYPCVELGMCEFQGVRYACEVWVWDSAGRMIAAAGGRQHTTAAGLVRALDEQVYLAGLLSAA
ncbi:hypothetical protein [Mycolicibacterium brisbanense]